MMGASSKAAAAAGAVGGRAARACDGCLRRRARWYCAADDAFLCQACDASVHSANPLARRHERLRLRPTTPSTPLRAHHSSTSLEPEATSTSTRRRQVAPAWSSRKARTRRPHLKSVGQLLSRKLVVPEVALESSEELKAEEERDEEEHLLYRVPTFDRALAELCSPPPAEDAAAASPWSCREDADGAPEVTKGSAVAPSPVQQLPVSLASYGGPTDAELREFAADMEALLGQGLGDSNELDGPSFYMESLGLTTAAAGNGGRVKSDPDGVISNGNRALCFDPADTKQEVPAEVLDMDFNYSSPTVVDDDDDVDSSEQKARSGSAVDAQFLQRSLDLRLNYEAIIESWGSSPWTDGQRPDVKPDDIWPLAYNPGGWTAGGGLGGEPPMPRRGMDGDREARVSRYREKRRTRLFAKKIRYEVRKLNAEKRPRMKGRFVKRPAAAGGAAAIAASATPCGVT